MKLTPKFTPNNVKLDVNLYYLRRIIFIREVN